MSQNAELTTKKFERTFRICLLAWVIVANAIVHVSGFEYGWLIFISNIMLFTLEGNNKDKFMSVEIGGLVGLVLATLMILAITALTPMVGDFLGFILPLSVVLAMLILLHPMAPKVFNNVGFAYLTVACVRVDALMENIWLFIAVFIAGSLIFNGVCLLIMKALEKHYFK